MTIEQAKEDRRTPPEILEHIYGRSSNVKQYVAWIETDGEDVMQRIWAHKKTKKAGTQYTEVIRKVLGVGTLYKNLYYTGVGGWQAVFERKDVSKTEYGYTNYRFYEEEFDDWYFGDQNWFKGGFYTLNIGTVFKGTKFEHCGYNSGDLIDYLERWNEDGRVELFGKLGIYPMKSLVSKAKRDPAFCRFLRDNSLDVQCYGSKATIYAYNHRMTVIEAQNALEVRRMILSFLPKAAVKKLDVMKVREYTLKQRITYGSYGDYITAVMALGLDLADTKNAFPKNFRQMHDLRTAEYEALKAEQNRAQMEKRNKEFCKAVDKFRDLDNFKVGEWCIILPAKITDLVSEGNALQHCVGRMGYDKKVIDGRSIIAFMRKSEEIGTPYITIEYGIRQKKTLQAHGMMNSNPCEAEWKAIHEWEKMMVKEGT